MRHSTGHPPPPCCYPHPCPSPKTWTCPPSFLNARGLSRLRPNYRTSFGHMTKVGTPCPPASNPTGQLPPSHFNGISIHPYWGMGRPKPNPAPQDPSLLIYRSTRLDGPGSPICPFSYYTYCLGVHRRCNRNIPYSQTNQGHKH